MNRTAANTGTRPIPEALGINPEALDRWLAEHVGAYRPPLEISLFKGGQSNPTYLLRTGGGDFVLRRKPPGRTLPGAHAVEREHRVLAALGGQGFPVPRVHGLCEDDSVVGTAFYVMDMVPGGIVWEAAFPGMDREQRAAHFDAMNATIAQLHGYDPQAIGLGDYGKASGFVERQVRRWSQQYLADEDGGRVPAMDRLVDWLDRHLPPDRGRSSVVHGDYRCDNMIFAPDRPQVRAVLDWELSTLGDPAADFTYHLLMYRMPAGTFTGLAGCDLEALGIPPEEEYVAAYCRRTGREHLPDKDYLVIFNLFRLCGILHGIRGRMARGSAASEHAAQVAAGLEPLAELAWAEAQTARL